MENLTNGAIEKVEELTNDVVEISTIDEQGVNPLLALMGGVIVGVGTYFAYTAVKKFIKKRQEQKVEEPQVEDLEEVTIQEEVEAE